MTFLLVIILSFVSYGCCCTSQFYAVQAEDRRSGYYVHHSHKTSEFLGGRTHAFQTEYDRPSKFFNIAKFREAGVTACVCARIHILDTLGLVSLS